MKKTRATALLMAAVMTLSCSPFNVMAEEVAVSENETVAEATDEAVVTSDEASSDAAIEAMAMDGWVTGWTGTASQQKDVLIVPTDTGVNMKTLKAGTGKTSNDEDSVCYFVYEMPSTADFKMNGTVKVNGYNADPSGTNPQQASFGAMIFDNLYQKGGRVRPYTNNVMVGAYMKGSSSANASIAAMHRYNGVKTMDQTLIDGVKKVITPEDNEEPFEFEIRKSDELVTVVANNESYTYNISDITTNPEIPYFKDTIYVGFYGCRNMDIEVSNVSIEADTRVVDSLELVSPPDKTEYVIDDALDLTGAKLVAHYTDGTSEVLEEYTVNGFDSSVMGERVMTFSKGGLSVEVPYKVSPIMCKKIDVTTMPVYSDYYIGQRFSSKAFEAEAEYNNGNKAVLNEDEYEFYIDGKKIDSDYYFTKADLGTKTVVVKHAVTDSVAESDASDSFKINVYDYTLSAITMGNLPTRTNYAVNDAVVPAGMTVRAIYQNAAGEYQYALLEEDEYEVLPVDTSKLGQVEVTVRYIKNPSLTTTFNINVIEKRPVAFTLRHYPRTTYQVGEDFTTEGMKPYILYNNDDMELTDAYTVDLSQFDNTQAGTTKVTIVPDNDIFDPIVLDVTITEKKTVYWKSTAFGASSTLNNNSCTPTYTEDGKLDSVTVRSWGGAGKITKDQDGISYFYTRMPAENNFTISADIYVNDYLEHDNSDEQRNGQEAFGIMARDVIPLNPDMDKLSEQEKADIQQALEQQAAAGKSEYIPITADVAKAELDENGEPVPALMNDKNYKVTFCSNMALLGGYSGTGWPTDPTATSYLKNSTINRINLVMRSGVYNYDGSNSVIEKHGPFKLSDTFPARGNKYRVTLTRINGGLYAKCYDYQTGVEKETYQYAEDNDEVKHLFDRQDSENMYVGFFAARWADITVSNIDFHESNPETDPITNNGADEASTPAIKLLSSEYSTTTDYNLSLRATNRLGGNVTIQKDGKVIYRDEPISKLSILPVELTPNSVNEFTVLYTPNSSDNITSTADVIVKFNITHKDKMADYDVLYCAPDGKVTGDGTRENPLDIYSAVGFLEMGKSVVALEGTYKMTKAFSIPVTNTGVEKAWKTLRADDGATVTLDMQGKYEGVTLDGYYWHIKGIDFTNSGKNLKPFLLAGNHCIIEDCKFYNNGDTGFQISRSTDSNINIDMWPSYNVIRDCEAYNNCDPSKINADGFGLKLTVGYGNIFERCISHNNLDDGYDAYTKKGEGAIGPVTLVNCVAYDNGNELFADGSTKSYDGGGNNGFKMGGESIAVQHYMKDCIAFDNNANGITTNTNPALKIRNFVSYRNGGSGFRLYTGDGNKKFDFDLKGCVSYKNSSKDNIQAYDYASLGNTAAEGSWPINANHSTTPINSASNYWDGENVNGDTITDEFFKSVDKNVSLVDNGKYAQDADGKFILGDFLARATEYVHEAGDEVNFPSGPQYGEPDTEETSAAPVETTTKEPVVNDDNNYDDESSSRRSGNSSHKASGIAEETTTEKDTETTTVAAKSFVTPSGVVITPPVSTGMKANFTDIAGRAWAVDSINMLASAGIVNGVSADKFAPDAYSKRADFIVMLVNTFGLTGPATDNFNDVDSNKYYADALAIAKTAGIATGYGDGNFGPENTITRQDMMVLVAKALEFAGVEIDTDMSTLDAFADADQIADYAKPYVADLATIGFVSGTDNGIAPTELITRAQMSVLVAQLYTMVVNMADEYAAEAAETEETSEEATEETSEDESAEDSTVEETTTEETTEAV